MAIISNIQRYSTHDGAGIRTTIFFKGCPLACKWCHNPETFSSKKQMLIHNERCISCGRCTERCTRECVFCGDCTDFCIYNAREIVGKDYTVKQLMKEIKKDQIFYEESGGGVTLSGGECMLVDLDFLTNLLGEIKKLGISVNIDTSGFAAYEKFQAILPYVDIFLYDLKIFQDAKHKLYTGVSNKIILDNLVKLSHDNANIEIRVPMIANVNATDDNIRATLKFLLENKIKTKKVYLLPYHNIGTGKYIKLGLMHEEFFAPTEEDMQHYKKLFVESGFEVQIGG